MSDIDTPPMRHGPGVWRLNAPLASDGLRLNCYLVAGSEGYILIDAGPEGTARHMIAAALKVTPLAEIHSMVLLEDGAFSCGGLGAWLSAGFNGEVIADWRFAAALQGCAGLPRIRALDDSVDRLFPGDKAEMVILRPDPPQGTMALFQPETGIIFTGKLASSTGLRPSPAGEDEGLAAQAEFARRFGYGPGISIEGISSIAKVSMLCPRFGAAIPATLAGKALGLSEALSPQKESCQESEAALGPIMKELDRLRSSNYELRESMVGASDTALRDVASGLYGAAYAEAFAESILQKKSPFDAAFVRIDRIKELNRRIGLGPANTLIRDLAALLQERLPEAIFFRWNGPVILMILEREGKPGLGHLEEARRAIAAEKRFACPITVSIAMVRSEEARGQSFASMQAIARERLKLLDRMGGDSVLDHSDIPLEEKSLVLALDSDPLFLDFLVEYLEREGFRTIGATRGGEALELMDRMKPEIIISDLALPQFDAFQIRLRMRNSNDLRDIPFILLTSAKNDDIIARAHSLSIFHILEKPLYMVELVGLARELLARREDGA